IGTCRAASFPPSCFALSIARTGELARTLNQDQELQRPPTTTALLATEKCRMAKLVFGMNMSLDGYVDHDHEAFAPDPALFRYFIEQTRNTTGSIYGRGLYELMRYWDGDGWHQDGRAQDDLRAFAEAWRAMPKWVVSRSLKEVGPNATLVGEDF